MRTQSGILVGVTVAAVLVAGCQQGSVSSLAPGATPGPQASNGPAPANADLYGTISFVDSSSFTSPPGDPKGNGSDSSTVTVHVAMARVSGTNEFTDAGSTYSQNQTAHRDRLIGVDPNTCEGVADTHGEIIDSTFGAPVDPDDPGSQISVLYAPEMNVFNLFVDTSLKLTTESNECMAGTAATESHWAGGPLACGAFGLVGKVTGNPTGPDQVDMACTLATDEGSVTVTGILTLKD